MKKRFSYSIIIPLLTRKKERKNERKKNREEFFLRVAPLFLFFPAKIVFSVSANSFLSCFLLFHTTTRQTEALKRNTTKTTENNKQQKEQPHSEH